MDSQYLTMLVNKFKHTELFLLNNIAYNLSDEELELVRIEMYNALIKDLNISFDENKGLHDA